MNLRSVACPGPVRDVREMQPVAVGDPAWARGMRERWDVWRHDLSHDGLGVEAGQ
jgi:hypothetical protein